MGRPPTNGGPSFRFTQTEVAEMEAMLQEHKLQIPSKDLILALSEKFSQSTERAGKVLVQTKQVLSSTLLLCIVCLTEEFGDLTLVEVWNWFQNKRYTLRSRLAKPSVKLTVTQMSVDMGPARNVPQGSQHQPAQSGRNALENSQMEFEAKSAKDGAWYDVQAFVSHRFVDTGNPEVLVRFAGFGLGEEEWVNVRKHVRQRSLPCELSECVAVLPGDIILCFQEGTEQALYFDAHVVDAQRRRHDVRGCRCRFLVRYDHDQTEEIVALRKICRRPETDYRLQQLHFQNESSSLTQKTASDPDPDPDPITIPSEAMPLNHKPSPNPSIGVPTSVEVNTSPFEPKKVETDTPGYILFAGSASTGANTLPSEQQSSNILT